MVKVYFLLVVIFINFSLFSQKVKIEDLVLIKPIYTKKYNENKGFGNSVKLKMDFNSPEILNQEDVNFLKDVSILKVELYYTAFQVSETFSQPKLNRERIQNLKKIFPELFNQSFVNWEFKAQNDCKNDKEAHEYFHGFVITYLPKTSKKETESEITGIKKLLKSDSLGYDSVYTVYHSKYKRKKYKTGYYLPTSKRKLEKGIVYEKKSFLKRKKQMEIRVDTISVGVQFHKFVRGKNAMSFVKRNLGDSTIFAVLGRHKNWNEIAFVCDVTGSMSSYSTQLLIWYKLNCMTNTIRYFTFFNDGDNKADKKKKIGSIGGIYNIEAGNYDAVEMMIQNAMKAGSGGDAPENNCEALIETIKKNPNAKEYVMIADNFANIKDIELIKQINKPVHIIICGTSNFMVNTDYLDLALATKGSIHSIENDIENLKNVNEGQTITFEGKKYILQNGKFHQVMVM
jgi:hypothetical protein